MAAHRVTPLPIIVTAIFSAVCAVGLSLFAISMVKSDVRLVNAAAWVAVGVILVLIGIYQLLVKRNRGILLVPLSIALVIGCVGETIDAFGTATLVSDAIGACILLVFAVPVILLSLPTSREWSRQK